MRLSMESPMSAQAVKVQQLRVPTQQEHYGKVFPMAYLCQSESADLGKALAWIRAHRDECLAQAAEHGVVFFRGFPLKTASDFDSFVEQFELPVFTYNQSLSNAVRLNHTPRVFSANEAPPEANINLHHEMAQTPIYPSKLFFFCREAASVGGATSVCRSDVLWDRLQDQVPEFARACAERGLKYTHTMPPVEDKESGLGRSWRGTLSVDTREAAEERLSSLGYTWEWHDNDCLSVTSPALPAVRKLESGRTAFFNQLIAALGWKDVRNAQSKALTFGDDSPMDLDGAQAAVELAEELTFDVPWQTGDLVLVDNYLVMHGRRTFQGSRTVLASFST